MSRFKEVGGELLPEEEVDLEALVDRAVKLDDLVKVWRAATPGFVREFTIEQRGRLRMLVKAVGGLEVAARTVAWSCGNWGSFVATTGLRRTPPRPHVGFLLAHAELAVNMAFQEQEPCQALDTREAVETPADPEMTQKERDEYEVLLGKLT